MGDPNFEKPYDKELESQLANLKDEVKLLKETLDKKKTEIQEKEKECHGKDDIIQGNVEIIQGKEIIVQGKDKEIQGKDIIIKGLRGIIQRKDKEIQEKDSIIKGLEEIIQKYKEIKKIQEKNNIIQENEEINIDSVNHENDNVIHENGGVIQENDTKIQEFAREIQEKDKKIKDLELDNIKLRDEAAKYQCALGAATNFRLPDNDKNNSVIFADDIISLQNSLEEYITKCKGGIITEIDIPGVQNLLKKYGSQTIITIDPKTIIIKAVLKRHVIEKVFEYANGYFNNPNARDIEVIMFRKCRDMVNLAMDFAEQRDGVDETTKSFPIKLRQQLFATLGNRGFNNVINRNNQKFLHDFIRKNQYNLNKEINKYRKLNPEKKKEIKEIEDMAGDIIRKVVTLFWFRLRVQEPVADKFWFKNNEKIDPNTMEGKWEDNDIDNIVVDICYFPLIANNLTRQIYTPAKVLHMHKNNLTNVENSSESLSSK